MEALVSIIMPAYNAEVYISEAIGSIREQTYQNWELIIVDDGSTDLTANIVKKFADLDNRIKYTYQQNSKQGKARNLGIKKSSGEFLAFLDTDDLWLPHKLEFSLKEFEKGDYDLLFTETYVFYNNNELVEISNLPMMNIVPGIYSGTKGLSSFLSINKIPFLTVLVRKEVVTAVGCFNDWGLAEDYELWLNLLVAGYTIKGIKIPLALYRIHANSSTYHDRVAVKGVAIMLSHFFNEHPEIKQYYKPQIKGWLKRLIILHYRSNEGLFKHTEIFKDFKKEILFYQLILKVKNFLPNKVINYLVFKLYSE